MTRDDLFTVTHFFHASARHKTEAQYSLDSLAQTIEAESRDAKDLLPWVKLARFANNPSAKGSLRHDANIVSITGGEGDYDAEKMSYDAAIAALSGANVACIVHTSPSHQADKPRWRVLAPTSKELPPGDRYKLVARLNGVLGGVLSAESFTLSQSYLYGHLDNGSEYRAIFLEGRCIDQCNDLDAGAIGKPGTKTAGEGNGHGDRYDQPYADRAELIRMIFSGESYHPAARSLLGSYAATGMSKEDALDILHTLGSGQPRYADRWDEIVQLADWVWAKEEAKKAPAPAPASPLPLANLALDGVAVPEPEWAVFNRIPLRHVCLLSGHGAVGKSTIALHLAVAHTLGRDWLKALAAMGGALFIDCEDEFSAIHYRLDAIRKFYGVSYQDLIDGGLEILPMSGLDCVMAVANPKTGTITPTAFYQQILERAGDLKYVQVVIANTANVFAGNENDRSQVQQFIGLLKRITNASGGSVMLIAHSSLTGLANETGLSGSTQWHNAVRARMWMHGTKANGSEPTSDVIALDFLKNQYGKEDERLALRWKNGLYLPEDVLTGYHLAARQAEVDGVFYAILERFKRRVSPNPSSTFGPALFAEEDEAKAIKATKVELRQAMDRLLASNRIKIAVWGTKSHGREYLVISN